MTQDPDTPTRPRTGFSLMISFIGNLVAWSVLLWTRHIASPSAMFELIPLFFTVYAFLLVEVIAVIVLILAKDEPAGRLKQIAFLAGFFSWPLFLLGIAWLI